MKKLIVSALFALGIVMGNFAADSYQVYKFQFNAKTTQAKGVVTSSTCCGAGDEYCYREKGTVKIQGILAGCGCGAIEANGVCKNAILYMWDATHKVVIKNVDASNFPWSVQRIGKKATGIEHFCNIKASYGPDDIYGFEIFASGFGTYKDNTKDANSSYVSSISGNFAGVANAPLYIKVGKCTACYVEDDQRFQSQAFSVCEECSEGFTEAKNSTFTPFFGTYSVSYDSGKSKACSKSGLSQKNLGLPSYVGIEDYVTTNIGE